MQRQPVSHWWWRARDYPGRHADAWEEDESSEHIVVSLSKALVQRTADDLGIRTSDTIVSPLCGQTDLRVEHIVHALDAERRHDFTNGRLLLDCLATSLAACLLVRDYRVQPVEGLLSREELRHVRDYVEANLGEDLSLARLADVAAFSVSHLKALFRRTTGKPVHRYVVERRVERARTLILEGELPLDEVAAATGFAHASHMATWMRRLTGLTPSALKDARRRSPR